MGSFQVASPVSYAQPSISYAQPAVSYAQPTVSFGQPGLTYAQPGLTYAQPALSFAQPAFAQPAFYGQQGFTFAQPQPLQYAPMQYAQSSAQIFSGPAVVPASPPSPIAKRTENIFARDQPQK